MDTKKTPIYPVEPWDITEAAFTEADNYRNETTFALSNGYIGTRGTLEESYDFDVDTGLEGNFINGFYESEHIRYGEWNFGFPTESQSLLNLPNMKRIQLSIGEGTEEEAFSMLEGRVESYARVLHMKEGLVTRDLIWTSVRGRRLQLRTERFVSLERKNLMAIRYEVTPLNFSGNVRLCSGLDADVENHTRKTNPLVDYGPFGRHLEPDRLEAEGAFLFYQGHTKNSGLSMACACGHEISGQILEETERKDALSLEKSWTLAAREGESLCLIKYLFYTSDLDLETEAMEGFLREQWQSAKEAGYEALRQEHVGQVEAFWEGADITVSGDAALQQGLRFNLFHIMQAAGRDGRTGMGAKGLSGEGYEGHYFWDTEMYVLPVFVYTAPELAKKLLDYRFDTLNQARERARVLGHEKGALYPWRTINGQEASTYFPLGTAQYHINADIAYAFWLYVQATGDFTYLKERAAEVLCETARVWADVGCFAECKGGRYCICAVTGPDEYNAIVDNNFYTNLMARENIRNARQALDWMKEADREAYERLIGKLSLTEEELAYWERIVEHMYFPYDETRGIYPQDDGFLMRKPWDDSKIPEEKRHLLYENYHPLFVYRQRMAKQADAILGMVLHSGLFTQEELERNYDFYQEVTLHHSSLSTCIFGILASRIGRHEEAYGYFAQSARMDLDDYHNNFYAGIHAANMAGTWQAIVCGFAGLRMQNGQLQLAPHLPEAWEGCSFRLQYRGSRLLVELTKETIQLTLLSGSPVQLLLGEKKCYIEKEGGKIIEKI